MAAALKQRLRFLLRRRVHVLDDEVVFSGRDRELERLYHRTIEGTYDSRDAGFVRQRYFESVRLRRAIETVTAAPIAGRRVLDVGAGNGAFALSIASIGATAVGIDAGWNDVARSLRRAADVETLESTTADCRHLPFRDASFDLVTAFETLEHLQSARQCGKEIVRVLKSGGHIAVITPPRMRYLLRRDPHFGIRALLALPDSLQRAVAARRGFSGGVHHVEHTYWTSLGIRSVFPGTRTAAIIARSFVPWLSWDLIVLQKK